MINIWTDGSCLRNPGPGGWAYVIQHETDEEIIESSCCSNKSHSTNNEMELTAVIEALSYIKTFYKNENISNISNITIYSDSKYVVDGITKWINNWMKHQQDRPNWKLWQQLYHIDQQIKSSIPIKYLWVKAHSTNEMNNIVDQLARSKAQELITV